MKEKLKEDFLDEDFHIQGNDEGELKEILELMSSSTTSRSIFGEDFIIYSVQKRRLGNEGQLYALRLKPEDMTDKVLLSTSDNGYFAPGSGNRGVFSNSRLKKWKLTDGQIQEILSRGFFFQLRKGDSYETMFPSKAFLSTFCRQVGCGKLAEGVNPFRDLYLASMLDKVENRITLVSRSNGSISKAFACFRGSFPLEPQTLFLRIKEELEKKGKKLKLEEYYIDHFMSRVLYSFKTGSFKIGNITLTPGIKMTLSDIGDSSYTLTNVLFVSTGGYVVLNSGVSKKHSTNALNIEAFVESYIKQISIFDKTFLMLNGAKKRSVSDVRLTIVGALQGIGLAKALGSAKLAQLKDKHLPNKEVYGNELDVLIFMLQIPSWIKRFDLSYFAWEETCRALGKSFK